MYAIRSYYALPKLLHPACLLLLLWVFPAQAAVTGLCSSCHTMHYSQDGGALSEWGDTGPYEALLTYDCVGCHMGVNIGGPIPFVFSSTEPAYGVTGSSADSNTLAGGNFYWVAQAGGDACGVITSYSIHYTKLYDMKGTWPDPAIATSSYEPPPRL